MAPIQKSIFAYKGIGKVDLLGLCEDGTLADVELKVEKSREDRRIGILEGRIYAAIVEANLSAIAAEVTATHGHSVALVRPRILLVASQNYWANTTAYPALVHMTRLVTEISPAVPINMMLLNLEGGELTEFGLDGSRPTVHRKARLSPVVASG